LEELKKPRDYTADLKKLLASANICDKRWVFEQYDSMVQTNTVQGPGGEAGVMRIKGTAKFHAGDAEHGAPGVVEVLAKSTPEGHAALHAEQTAKGERGLAMALAGNGRWCYLDPKLGAMHAVAEAARKVACTGATPVAATNCLNFGNPEKPEIMAQLSAAIDGIAEACTALGTPVTGGNVSLYNETKGEGIYPTPVLGVVGILDDVTKAVPADFQRAGQSVFLLSAIDGVGRSPEQDLGSTEYARLVTGQLWGTPQPLNLAKEAALHRALAALADHGLIESACDISDGGSFVTFAEAGFRRGLGIHIEMKVPSIEPLALKEFLFSEIPSSVIVTADPGHLEQIQSLLKQFEGVWISPVGTTQPNVYSVAFNGQSIIETTIAELKAPWTSALESQLAAEVVTA
jgi:phosphoribosylformylglycinamidine synthase